MEIRWCQAVFLDLSQRHKQNFGSAKPDDLRANRIATRITDITQFTQRDVCWTERFNYEPNDIAHLAVSRQRIDLINRLFQRALFIAFVVLALTRLLFPCIRLIKHGAAQYLMHSLQLLF